MKKDLSKTLFEVTPKIQQLADLCEKNNAIVIFIHNMMSKEDSVI